MVTDLRMTQAEADREIAVMQVILANYEARPAGRASGIVRTEVV